MRKILFISLFFVSVLVFKYAYCGDNLLAVDISYNKEKAPSQPDKSVQKSEDSDKVVQPQEGPLPDDDSNKEFKKMKAYREILENKQKELEVIKLDLEKSSLLLKKKEAEKEIYQIDKVLPQGKKEEASISNGLTQDVKDTSVDPSDIKIQFLVISDNLKEGQISLKGIPYGFKEGDSIASKLTVEKIDPAGVTFREPDGTVLKINFIN